MARSFLAERQHFYQEREALGSRWLVMILPAVWTQPLATVEESVPTFLVTRIMHLTCCCRAMERSYSQARSFRIFSLTSRLLGTTTLGTRTIVLGLAA